MHVASSTSVVIRAEHLQTLSRILNAAFKKLFSLAHSKSNTDICFPHLVIIVYLLPDVVVIIVTRWYGKCVIGGNMNLKAESHAEFLKRSVLLLLP